MKNIFQSINKTKINLSIYLMVNLNNSQKVRVGGKEVVFSPLMLSGSIISGHLEENLSRHACLVALKDIPRLYYHHKYK